MTIEKSIRIRQIDFLSMQFNMIGSYMKQNANAFDEDIVAKYYPKFLEIREELYRDLKIEEEKK